MPEVTTLTPADYAVYVRIPTEYYDENVCGAEIAQVLHKTSGDVLRRIARLVMLNVVQRRKSAPNFLQREIRRVLR